MYILCGWEVNGSYIVCVFPEQAGGLHWLSVSLCTSPSPYTRFTIHEFWHRAQVLGVVLTKMTNCGKAAIKEDFNVPDVRMSDHFAMHEFHAPFTFEGSFDPDEA
jgi:hypothetical protein